MGAKTNEPQRKGNTRFSIDASALPDDALPDIFLWLLCSTDACALDEMLKACPDRLAGSLGYVQFRRLDLLSQISIAKNSALWEKASSFFEERVKSISSGNRENDEESKEALFQNAMGLLVCACSVPSCDPSGTPSPKDSARALGLCSLAFFAMEEEGRCPGRGPFPNEAFWRRLSRGLCLIEKADEEQATRDLCSKGLLLAGGRFFMPSPENFAANDPDLKHLCSFSQRFCARIAKVAAADPSLKQGVLNPCCRSVLECAITAFDDGLPFDKDAVTDCAALLLSNASNESEAIDAWNATVDAVACGLVPARDMPAVVAAAKVCERLASVDKTDSLSKALARRADSNGTTPDELVSIAKTEMRDIFKNDAAIKKGFAFDVFKEVCKRFLPDHAFAFAQAFGIPQKEAVGRLAGGMFSAFNRSSDKVVVAKLTTQALRANLAEPLQTALNGAIADASESAALPSFVREAIVSCLEAQGLERSMPQAKKQGPRSV